MSKDFNDQFLDCEQKKVECISELELNKDDILSLHHICLQKDCLIFDDLILPFGEDLIIKRGTEIIDEILIEIIPIIQKDKNKKIIICGSNIARRMLGRKLEDRLKREVFY